METKTIISERLILRKAQKEDVVSLFNNWDSDIMICIPMLIRQES